MPTLPKRVHIVDVGPRDGLQNEKQMIPADVKVELVDRLTDAGFTNIEVTSFVSPKWVPQMADAAEVMARIRRKPGVHYSVLMPNMKGFEGALAAKADEIVVFAAASEAFSQSNINCSIDESIERFRPVAAQAQQHGIASAAPSRARWAAPTRAKSMPDAVAHVARRMKDIGVQHVGVADTIGTGTPEKTKRVMEAVLARLRARCRGQRPFSRHLRHGHRQCVRVPRAWHLELRFQHRRAGRLPVCEGRDRQRRHRGRAVPAQRPRHRNRHRLHESGRDRPMDQRHS